MNDNDQRRVRARKLADELFRKGEIQTEAWRQAFSEVPREVFIPVFATYADGGSGTEYRLFDGTDPAQRDAWLSLVYSDTTLIVQVGERPIEDVIASEVGHGHATSSSTAPGLMARLLEALDVHDGHKVLEIGTGTGFNAGVLSARLGSGNVTSVDIDPDLTAKAKNRLASLGLTPHIHTIDGREGWAGQAPFDRIIATCSTPHVPPAWVEQTRNGGAILANVAGALAGAMALLDVVDGRAEGRFLKRWAGFMWARPGFTRAADIRAQDTDEGAYDTTAPKMDVGLLQDQAFAFVLQLALPEVRPYWARDDQGGEITGLITPDGSWAEHVTPADGNAPYVDQGGPQRLWTITEQTHRWWYTHERPDWSGFGMTVTEGRQVVWFGSPYGDDRWELPVSVPQ